MDTQKLKIWRKCVRPVEKQGEFESRRLWQHVTNALNAGDVNTATEHKHLVGCVSRLSAPKKSKG